MAKERMAFPRFVDRPRLFIMFEIDEVLYSLGGSSILSGFLFVATANLFIAMIAFIAQVFFVRAIVVDLKKSTQLPGAFFYMKYASGYASNFPMKKKDLLLKWPELKRMDTLEFIPFGFEDEFLS